MRRLHFLDPQLRDLEGHYLRYCEQAVRELAARGVPVTVYGRQGCRLSLGSSPVHGVFSREIFQDACSDPETWAIENYHNLNQVFLGDLLRVDPAQLSDGDVAFFPSITENQLLGAARWLGRIPAQRRPAAVVLLRFPNHDMEYVRARPHPELVGLHYRHAARALVAAQPRALLCADTEEMAGAYRSLTGLPVVQVPVAMEPVVPPPEGGRAGPGRPQVVFLGHTSKLRGFHLLPGIIERCLRHPAAPRFVVHVQSRERAEQEQLGAILQRLDALAGTDVRLVEGSLNPDEYFRLLREGDLLLLPYAPAFYGRCSSGIFAEAAMAGKPVVVPADTVGARLGRRYGLGVVEASKWDAAALAAALDSALRGLAELTLRSEAGAERFRSEQGVKAFWDRIQAEWPEAAETPALAAG